VKKTKKKIVGIGELKKGEGREHQSSGKKGEKKNMLKKPQKI